MDDRHLALKSQRARLGHHVLLGDPALDEPIRELARESEHAGIDHQIAVQRHDLGV